MAVVCQYRTIKSWHQGLFLSQFIQRRSSELVVMAGPEEKCWLISYAGELLWHCQTIIWCEVIIGQTPGDPMEIYSNSTALIESQWQGRFGFPCPLYQTVVSGFTVGREGVCRLCNVGISCVFYTKSMSEQCIE